MTPNEQLSQAVKEVEEAEAALRVFQELIEGLSGSGKRERLTSHLLAEHETLQQQVKSAQNRRDIALTKVRG